MGLPGSDMPTTSREAAGKTLNSSSGLLRPHSHNAAIAVRADVDISPGARSDAGEGKDRSRHQTIDSGQRVRFDAVRLADRQVRDNQSLRARLEIDPMQGLSSTVQDK